MLSEYAIGQRWVSNTEVDLGLGIVVELEGRRVTVHFPAVEQDRVYASKDAPLSRIIYKENQKIKDVSKKVWIIKGIQESNAVLFYQVIKMLLINILDISMKKMNTFITIFIKLNAQIVIFKQAVNAILVNM